MVKKAGHALSGGCEKEHFGDFRALPALPEDGAVFYDAADIRLSSFVTTVLDPNAIVSFPERPDIAVAQWGIEHFRSSSYQYSLAKNGQREFETEMIKAFISGQIDVEAVTLDDFLYLSQFSPSELCLSEAIENNRRSLKQALDKHAQKVDGYRQRMRDELDLDGLAFFVHSEIAASDRDYLWWRDPVCLRWFAALSGVDYVIWSREHKLGVGEITCYRAAVYSVASLQERFTTP